MFTTDAYLPDLRSEALLIVSCLPPVYLLHKLLPTSLHTTSACHALHFPLHQLHSSASKHNIRPNLTMTRDTNKRRPSLPTHRSNRDLVEVSDYRTRTPSHTKRTGLRSASPSPIMNSNNNNTRDTMSVARSDLSYGYGQDDRDCTESYYGRESRRSLVECSRRTVEPRNSDSYGSNRAIDEGPQHSVLDPGFRPHTGRLLSCMTFIAMLTAIGVPIKGAASTDLTKTTLPKHFTQPLTCFYWHKNGFCTKSDEACLLVYTL